MTNNTSDPVYSPEKIAAIRKIRKLMDFWRITPNEIRVAPKVNPLPVPAPAAPARYQHPITGETWDGAGRQPDWLRQALLREGYTVEELRRAVGQTPVMQAEVATIPTQTEAHAEGFQL